MKRNNIMRSCLILAVSVLTLSACYEDKGNYDYHDINEVIITGIEPEYAISIGEGLTIKPVLTNTIDGTEDIFTYCWYGVENSKRLNTEKELLDWVPPLDAGLHKLYYGVRDTLSGVEFYSDVFTVRISNDIRSGILFMSEKTDGSGQVNFLNYVDDEFFVKEVVPADMPDYGKPIGIWTYPDLMGPMISGSPASQRFSICIVGEEGAYRLSPSDLHYEPAFNLEHMILFTPPEGFYVAEIYPLKGKYNSEAMLRTNFGDIMRFSRTGPPAMMWTNGIHINTWSNGERIDVSDMLVTTGWSVNTILFDQETKSFIKSPYKSSHSERFLSSLETKFKFNNTGSDLVYLTGREKEGTTWDVVYALTKTTGTSNYKLLNFCEDGTQIAHFDLSGIEELTNAVEFEMTTNNENNELLYYRTATTIYCYNMLKGTSTKVYSAPTGNVITLMKINNVYENNYYSLDYNNDLIVATYDASKGDTGGTIELYKITPLTGALVLDEHGSGKPTKWTGFAKIISSDHKSM